MRRTRTRFEDARRTIVVITLVGLALRVGWWWIAHPEPVSDFLGYRSIAFRLITNGEYSRGGMTTAFRTPGYPGFLGLGMIVWRSDRWLSMVNVGVSTAAIPLVAWFAARAGLGRRIAIVSAALVAILPTFVLWAPVLASEHLQIALILVAWSLSCATVTRSRALVAGLVYGVAVLVRPESLFFLLAVPLLIRIAGPTWRHVVPLAAITVVTAGLVVAPWYVRNEIVVGRGSGLSTSGGLNFYLAHREHGYRFVEPALTPLRGLDELETNRQGYSLGLQTIRSNPFGLVRTTLHYSYELYRTPTYVAQYSTRKNLGTPYRAGVSQSVVERARLASTIGWIVTLGLVPVGLAVLWADARRRTALRALVGLLAANWLCFAVVFWGMPRDRYAVEPVLVVIAAAGITSATKVFRVATRRAARDRETTAADPCPVDGNGR